MALSFLFYFKYFMPPNSLLKGDLQQIQPKCLQKSIFSFYTSSSGKINTKNKGLYCSVASRICRDIQKGKMAVPVA